jgi:opacity protein-like surface antigen
MSFKKFTVRAFLITLFFYGICPFQKALAQRIVLPADSSNGSTPISLSSTDSDSSQILKTYPDGTKKIVPLAPLNSYDNGKDFGGPPQPRISPDSISKSSSERLSVAPIGTTATPATINTTLPTSPDSMGASTLATAAGDPMGGGSAPNPMDGGSAPVDPLSGVTPKGSPPPLQTVSGKPAPVSSAETSIELGTYDDFFMNAAIGGSIQGQLTSRRIYNGTNMQAYPYQGISAENFTFNPGFRFDVEFGYNIYDWLGLSLQTGIVYNGINQYNFNLTSPTAINGQTYAQGSYHCSADGELVQVPVQIDGILRWPGTTAFKPFIGGGIGAIWQQLDVNNLYLGNQDVQGNYCRSAFQFGFNAQLGVNYTVTPGVDFYGAFKLLGAFTPRIGNYDFENSYNFALEVGIQSRF